MPMGNPLKTLVTWFFSAVADKAMEPLTEIKSLLGEVQATQQIMQATIEAKHQEDPVAKECDLAILDNQICEQIAKCREKHYTTAEDRRRITRMHEAYKARGGNHGEENEYAIFCALPTKEDYFERMNIHD